MLEVELCFALLLFGLYAAFTALFIVCDTYLIPAVEVFISAYNIPEEVPAVTFIAFGSASPELFLNSVSAVSKNSDMSLAAILGSGMIAFGLIPPIAIVLVPAILGPSRRHQKDRTKKDRTLEFSSTSNSSSEVVVGRYKALNIKLKLYPIFRECGFYILGLLLFLATIIDGKIGLWESILIVGAYVVYLSFVLSGLKSRNVLTVTSDGSKDGETDFLVQGRDADLEISSINSDSSGSSTASFHSLNNDLTPVASEAAKTSSMQLLKESVGTVLLISANKASTSNKQKTKYYDCISETSCSSSGVNSPALDPNLTKLSRGSKIGSGYKTQSGDLEEVGVGSPATITPLEYGDLEDVEAPSTRAAYQNSLFSCLSRTSRMLHYSISSPLEAFFVCIFPSLNPPQPNVLQPGKIQLSKTKAQTIDSSFDVSNDSSLRLLLPKQAAVQDQQQHHGRDMQSRTPLWRAIVVLLLSILFIGLLTSLVVFISTNIVLDLHLDSSTIGATLVALGSEIPDCMNSIALARGGFYDGALAGAIGSQVINITLGVGLPALLFCFSEFLNDFRVDDYIKIAQKEANSLFLLTCLLLVVILTYVSVIAPFFEMFRSLLQAAVRRCRACTERDVEGGSRSTYMPEHVILTYVGATIQILVFIAVYAVFISTNEMKSS
eukprot:gene22334-30578_t